MTMHLEECQRRVQYDLRRYNCQSQEHYGKIAKTTVKTQTNYRLGRKDHKGKYSKSYVQQMVEVMLHRKQLNMAVPVRPSEYSRRKQRQVEKAQAAKQQHQRVPRRQPKLEKKAQWPEVSAAMSEAADKSSRRSSRRSRTIRVTDGNHRQYIEHQLAAQLAATTSNTVNVGARVEHD